jgi:hypothetical protein
MWEHKKEKQAWKGSYVKAAEDNVFQLTLEGSKRKPITFNSWQAAKKAGWVKVK